MNKIVIYTSIFGNYDNLVEPIASLNCDFICFTDNKNINSNIWKSIYHPPIYNDSNRNAKKFKILPHRYLQQYEYSIWIDGNMLVKDDITELITQYLSDSNIAFFDHNYNILDPRNCIYKEAEAIFELGRKNNRYKDDPNIISNQINKYKKLGYPENSGLITGMIIIRKHNELDVINSMEDWWSEIKYNSKRDQLSFNYVAWENNLKVNYIKQDSRNNKWFLHTGKHKGKNIMINNEYVPISFDYFCNMELQAGGGGKEIILNNYQLKTVGDVIKFFSNPENIEDTRKKLTPQNWQYFNVMITGWRKNVKNHHELGWENITEKYLNSLEPMSNDEIKLFLEQNSVEFENGFIRHSYHRAMAAIGHYIQTKKYYPFYMKKELVYDTPREKDGIHRIKSPIYNVKYLNAVELPKEYFAITQSGILALMGIRNNDDLDIIIHNDLRDSKPNYFDAHGNYKLLSNYVYNFPRDYKKFNLFDAQGDSDLIENYTFEVDGYKFLEPRFYFYKKSLKTERDILDIKKIVNFFEKESQLGYPFNQLSEEQWGIEFIYDKYKRI